MAFPILPMSFRDFLSVQYEESILSRKTNESLEKFSYRIGKSLPLNRQLRRYFICGGIPRVVNDYLDDRRIDLDTFSLYKDWLVSEIAKNGKQEQFAKNILQRVLLSISGDVSYNAFAQDSGIGSHNTVYDYLRFLEDAFVLRQVFHFDYHQKKINFRKNKKIYLHDPFLWWLLEWWISGDISAYTRMLKNRSLQGKMAENLVLLHLKKKHSEVFFSRNTHEIDFVSGDCAWECKYTGAVSSSDIRALRSFPGKKYVITKNILKKEGDIQYIPLALFLLT